VVNDFYKRFINREASDKQQVRVGRISTVVLMIFTGFLALVLSNALQAFNILLQIGAGTGLLFILRWFWWRINPYSELTAMGVSFVVAVYWQIVHAWTGLPEVSTHVQLVSAVAVTTVCWILVTLVTRPSDTQTLRSFYRLVKPGGPGWRRVIEEAAQDNDPVETPGKGWDVPTGIVCMVVGCLGVYSALFATGYWIYGQRLAAALLSAVAVISTVILVKTWKKLRIKD
jgi:hypothetical protein